MAKPSKGFRLVVGDDEYLIDLDEYSAQDSKDFRLATGTSLMHVFASGQVDLDVFAGLIWLERRKRNPRVTYDSIASTLTYGTPIDVYNDGEKPDADDA